MSENFRFLDIYQWKCGLLISLQILPRKSKYTFFESSDKLQGLHSKTGFSKTTEGEAESSKDYTRKISLYILIMYLNHQSIFFPCLIYSGFKKNTIHFILLSCNQPPFVVHVAKYHPQ